MELSQRATWVQDEPLTAACLHTPTVVLLPQHVTSFPLLHLIHFLNSRQAVHTTRAWYNKVLSHRQELEALRSQRRMGTQTPDQRQGTLSWKR